MKKIADIHCPNCGAPADFDIINQNYHCGHCGSNVEIKEALKEKQGFRKMNAERIKNSVSSFSLSSASCSGCGANVIFEENEALSNCPYCGRSLVRSEYLDIENLPEYIIPFAITKSEAADRLRDWCKKNRRKKEAKMLVSHIPNLKAHYLPYELVRGPVHMTVSRMDGGKDYACEGFLNNEFVNCSKQLDNLLLDGMEPFDTDALKEFDFAYVAGHHVKIPDITNEDLQKRAKNEAGELYRPSVRKTLETRAVDIDAGVNDALRLPVLLPVYYICEGKLMAAVNGQTGKVSVRAENESHYIFLPWWLKAIIATLAFSGALLGSLILFGMERPLAISTTAIVGFFFIIVNLCLFSDTAKNRFAVESGRKIYTSGEKTFRRERGGLVLDSRILKRKIMRPVYFADVKDKLQPVTLRFTTPKRVIRLLALSLTVLFLPVILALFINGFDFSMIRLGGSAVWFCIFVPVVPIYILKFGVVDLHNNPWIYYQTENGSKRRYKTKKKFKFNKEIAKSVLRAVFVPPMSLGVWFGVICFFVMVYLTAGYGWD